MWAYDFMQHALYSGLIIATVCGIVSVFVVLGVLQSQGFRLLGFQGCRVLRASNY